MSGISVSSSFLRLSCATDVALTVVVVVAVVIVATGSERFGGLGGGGPTVSGGESIMFRLLPALPKDLPWAFCLADGLRLAFGLFAAATSLAIVDVSACCQP
jgi:hypothetical protein